MALLGFVEGGSRAGQGSLIEASHYAGSGDKPNRDEDDDDDNQSNSVDNRKAEQNPFTAPLAIYLCNSSSHSRL